MSPVAVMAITLISRASQFDEMSELAFKQGNSALYAKYAECATRLRECADKLAEEEKS